MKETFFAFYSSGSADCTNIHKHEFTINNADNYVIKRLHKLQAKQCSSIYLCRLRFGAHSFDRIAHCSKITTSRGAEFCDRE